MPTTERPTAIPAAIPGVRILDPTAGNARPSSRERAESAASREATLDFFDDVLAPDAPGCWLSALWHRTIPGAATGLPYVEFTSVVARVRGISVPDGQVLNLVVDRLDGEVIGGLFLADLASDADADTPSSHHGEPTCLHALGIG